MIFSDTGVEIHNIEIYKAFFWFILDIIEPIDYKVV